MESLIADGAAYDDQYLTIVVKFAGDCKVAATRLLELEPLARSIRMHMSAIDQDGERRRTLLHRSDEESSSETQRHAELLKKLGATEGDILQKEPAMLATCDRDPTFREARLRVSRSSPAR